MIPVYQVNSGGSKLVLAFCVHKLALTTLQVNSILFVFCSSSASLQTKAVRVQTSTPQEEKTAEPLKALIVERCAADQTTITHNSIKPHSLLPQLHSNQSIFHKRIMLQSALNTLQIMPLSLEDTWAEDHTCSHIQECVHIPRVHSQRQ